MNSSKEQDPFQQLSEQPEPHLPLEEIGGFFPKLWHRLVSVGLGESALRAAMLGATTLVLLGVVLVMGNFYVSAGGGSAAALAPSPTPLGVQATEVVAPALAKVDPSANSDGIARSASLHTIRPAKPRTGLTTYVVQAGDNLFSVAEKFGLKPESVLWGNRYTLGDDPHTIIPGQDLIILPVDGTVHRWSAGEGLNGVADYYHVTPEAIINFPANGLNPATIGDYANPNITPGTLLIIPGGYGEFTDWRTPRITRDDPAVALNVGPGACTSSYDGILGTQNFTWPLPDHVLSGYDYSPEANHFGIDIAGTMGESVYAADNGIVVYAGWNDWGYGEMVVIDHGGGWQTLYAHLSTVAVTCGQEVYRGDTIGTVGDTGNSIGPHLHFELRNDNYGRMNPWDFLQ